ncbi:penicillin acylase family protein [Chloroflexota bacterium]
MNKKIKKVIGLSVLFLISFLLIALIIGFLWIKGNIPRSFPITDGEINLNGLNSEVKVYRDDYGIPNIYAETTHDLFMAQGFIHAQDRFWQMDFWRHIGSGRLSEMFASEIETDIFLRTLGWRMIAEKELELFDPDTLSLLSAYSEGVNAYLKNKSGSEISLEYSILKLLNPDYSPEPWTPINTLTWAKSMAWDLGGNLSNEINRALLLRTISSDYVNELYPSYSQDHPVIVQEIGDISEKSIPSPFDFAYSSNIQIFSALSRKISAFSKILGPIGNDIGSNNWVVSGDFTETGFPLLANDPHLGIQLPSIWYQVGLHCSPVSVECPFNVTGFSFAGVPGIIIGHNDRIAWGVTNAGPDVQDLFIEKVNPANPNQYEYKGTWIDMDTRIETINVAGGEPREIIIRSTIHGPIISDSYGPVMESNDPAIKPFSDKAGIPLPENFAVSLSWTALEPSRLFEAIWGFDKAQNWNEFREAAKYFVVPAQNLVYADVDGNIGYQLPGNIPIRLSGDGRLPVPGWTGEYDWQGYIPYENLPYILNPDNGYIVTANNQVNPWDYPYSITTDWDYGYRAERIVDQVEANLGSLSIETFKSIQGDNYDYSAALLIPLLLDLDTKNNGFDDYLLLFQNWDFQNSMDSAPAALYASFWKYFLINTFGDDLPSDMQPEGSSRWFEVVHNMALDASSHWWDSILTPDVVETREFILELSFIQAVKETISLLGNDETEWRWGNLHTATFKNQTLGTSGISVIENLFNRGPFQTSGGASIVNATGWYADEGYEVVSLPSLRMIVDFSNMDNSLAIHTTGQSGHAYNSNYIDMADLWRNIQYYPMLYSESLISQNSGQILILHP